MGYRLHETAVKELKELRVRLLNLVGHRVLTAEQAQKEHWEAVRRLYATALTDDGRTCIPICCNGCGKIVVVASDVQRYNCNCSPNVERYTVKSMQIDLPIGTSPITDLISPGGAAASPRS